MTKVLPEGKKHTSSTYDRLGEVKSIDFEAPITYKNENYLSINGLKSIKGQNPGQYGVSLQGYDLRH